MRMIKKMLFTALMLVSSTALAAKGTILYIPMDNRPVCLYYTVETMQAAGWDVQTPPLEYIANDKNQYLKSPEFATSIGLLMESLKIHDKKPVEKPVEEPKVIEVPQTENTAEEVKTEEQKITQHIEEVKKTKPTFGQSILEKVKKFFEEVE